MLSDVLELVHARGWFDTARAFEKNVYLSQGASLWMVLMRRGRPDTFVKFSNLVDLEIEAKRCDAAARAYPDHAPHFVGYARSGSLNLLAARAVAFGDVTVDTFDSTLKARTVRDGLTHFFERGRSMVTTKRADIMPEWWSAVRAYYSNHPLRDLAEPALDDLAPLLPLLPRAPQHGDLVMNNLGVRDNGHLIIFDWEDFGEVDLPGLDLFTLEYSFGLAANWLRAQGRASDLSRVLNIAAVHKALGLDQVALARLRLPCALVFRYLKRNYGPDVRERLDELIRSLQSETS